MPDYQDKYRHCTSLYRPRDMSLSRAQIRCFWANIQCLSGPRCFSSSFSYMVFDHDFFTNLLLKCLPPTFAYFCARVWPFGPYIDFRLVAQKQLLFHYKWPFSQAGRGQRGHRNRKWTAEEPCYTFSCATTTILLIWQLFNNLQQNHNQLSWNFSRHNFCWATSAIVP